MSLIRPAVGLCLLAFPVARPAAAEPAPVVVYAAGSLRDVVAELGRQVGASYQVEIKPTFGGSGLLREKIEQGEKPDLFLSADLGSPRSLASKGFTRVPVLAFARNQMCVVSRQSAHVTSGVLVESMLRPDVRIKTSQPVADPSGDYAWAIFERVEAMRPGKGQALKDKAQRTMDLKAPAGKPDQSAAAALFATNQIDLTITYCSGVAGLLKEVPELASLPVPPALEPHPVYGVAVLSDKPEAWRVALYLLSDKGQSILTDAGFLPILTDGSARP